jgi:hypothetical protein
MTDNPPTLCPHCGQALPNSRPLADRTALADHVHLADHMLHGSTWNISDQADVAAPGVQTSASPPDEIREYDHRGVPMPRRTRMGGIITPQ